MRPSRKLVTRALGVAGLAAAVAVSLLDPVESSSHREALAISEDPVADTTDVYAFVSPDRPDSVTMVGNWIPLEEPAGGPNFHKFGDDVLYELNVDNDGDAQDDVVYEFRFKTTIRNPGSFLYNTGPINSVGDSDWNQPQTYTVTQVKDGKRTVLGADLPTPPVNVGPRSTPDYERLAAGAVRDLPGGIKVFAGQRDDPFFADLGSVFDLLGLRPLNGAHALPRPTEKGKDAVNGYNTHTIAIQVPTAQLLGEAKDPVIGVYSATYRRKTRVLSGRDGRLQHQGPWIKVSRLGMPLVNELSIPLRDKDRFNASEPADDAQFAKYVRDPEPARLIPALYPVLDPNRTPGACFPKAPRDDLVAIFLTGVDALGNKPRNVVPSERIRLNTGKPSSFPNGRLLSDDVVDVELQALAGGIAGLQACGGKSPNNALTDGVDANDKPFLRSFPYVATPHQGYDHDHDH